MGQAVAVVVGVAAAVVHIISSLVHSFESPENIAPNPVMEELEKRAAEERRRREEAEREQERLEQERQNAERERQQAEGRRRQADEENARAQQRQREAEEQRRRADEEMHRAQEEQRRAEEERRRAEEERQKAQHAQTEAEEDKRRVEEARTKAERERQQAAEAGQRAEEARKKANQQQQQEQRARQEAERASAAATLAAAEARSAQEEAERKLREGVRPVIWPTEEQIRDTKKRLNYTPGKLHFAVAGISGSGKSSLINALRGITNNHRNAARVGVIETTMEITSYADPDPRKPFLWYDIPGAGTLSIPDWQYFNDQGLYIFDSIIVLFDNRFTATDVALLRNAQLFNIPTYVLRSKSKQHIANLLSDMEFNEDEDKEEQYVRAREAYISKTRESVANNLLQAGLPHQRVYLVDAKAALYSVVLGKRTNAIIDELDFMLALLKEAHDRRVKPSGSGGTSARKGASSTVTSRVTTNATPTAYQAASSKNKATEVQDTEVQDTEDWDVVTASV